MKEKLNRFYGKQAARLNAVLEIAVLSALSAWCLASLTLKLLLSGVFGGFTELGLFARSPFLLTAMLFVLYLLLALTARNLTLRRGKTPPETVLTRLLCVSFGGYCAVTLPVNDDPFFCFVLCALWAALLSYALRRRRKPFRLSRRAAYGLIGATAAAFLALVGGVGVLRYVAFRAPNFDFGIFAQLFEGMKRCGLPVTTCERDRLLSHFAVHLSPVLYLLLPVYWAFPHPATLQIAQAAVLASAAVPMALLCRERGFSPVKTALLAAVTLFHPAVTGGTNYDFHENCFLLPLLLWLFYFAGRKKPLPMLLCAAAVFSVKEDAAVYVAFFALFLFFDQKRYAAGVGLLALSLGWFLLALRFLTAYGEGVMTNRYDNFIVEGGGLWEAVQNVLKNPAYAFTQLFAEASGGHGGKLLYALYMLVPLGFLPLCARRPSRLLLLLPAVLVNLLTLYVYQYDIGFQYSFGSMAFLLYLSVLNCAELQPETGRRAVACAAAACMLFTAQRTLPRFADYLRYYAANRADLAVMEDYLASLPREASVTCTTMLVAHLSKHEILYETAYHDPAGERTDYVIFDAAAPEEEIAAFAAAGYVPALTVTNGGRSLLRVYVTAGE